MQPLREVNFFVLCPSPGSLFHYLQPRRRIHPAARSRFSPGLHNAGAFLPILTILFLFFLLSSHENRINQNRINEYRINEYRINEYRINEYRTNEYRTNEYRINESPPNPSLR